MNVPKNFQHYQHTILFINALIHNKCENCINFNLKLIKKFKIKKSYL